MPSSQLSHAGFLVGPSCVASWLYLRTGAEDASPAGLEVVVGNGSSVGGVRSVRLAAVGDIFVASSTPKFSGGADEGVLGVFEELRKAAVVCGNLEQAVGSDGFAKAKKSLTAGLDVLDELKWAGFDVLSVANNHFCDLGIDQALASVGEMRRRGLVPVGAGRDLAEATRVAVVEVDGCRLGFVSFFCAPNLERLDVSGVMATDASPGVPVILGHDIEWDHVGSSGMMPDSKGMGVMRRAVESAASEVDALIVTLHWHWWWRWWGAEERQVVYPGMQIMGRAAVEAGADVVLGHGPHMLSGVEFYRGAPIVYSLGNFIFQLRHGGKALPQFWHSPGRKMSAEAGRWELPSAQRSMILNITLSVPKERAPEVELIPLELRMAEDGNPRVASPEVVAEVVKEVESYSKGLGTRVVAEGHRIVLSPG